jgi:hypothetical protein
MGLSSNPLAPLFRVTWALARGRQSMAMVVPSLDVFRARQVLGFSRHLDGHFNLDPFDNDFRLRVGTAGHEQQAYAQRQETHHGTRRATREHTIAAQV